MKDDVIRRQDAIDALWKALYEYEDKTEKQFQESENLDVGDWIEHRIFVQNMNDIDRQTILNLPSAQPDLSEYSDKLWKAAYERGKKDAQLEIVYCRECIHWRYDTDHTCRYYGGASPRLAIDFCSKGERRTDE